LKQIALGAGGSVLAPRLRPYQTRSIEQLRAHCAARLTRLLLAIPTGGGKTLTASDLIRSSLGKGLRVLFVVHLRELVDQTVRAFEGLGITHVGVMRGDDDRIDASAPVQIASIQTLARRDKPIADVIVLDECHRSISAQYVKYIWEAYPDATIIGLTATPCRGDERPLGEWYQALVIGATYSELIADGYISEPIIYAPKVLPDLSHVHRVAGDWNEGDLEEEMAKIAGNIVPDWLEHAAGRKTIAFACGIAHSKDIVRRFLDAGVAAEHLDGTTPGAEREAILERLRTDETTVVSNCAVLTEGFDLPSIRCAIIARPTLSLVLHMQTAGRALRPGDIQPVILDHAGNCARHGMPHQDRGWRIDGPPVPPKDANPYKTCKFCFVYISASADVCPHCGAEQPKKPRELPIEEPAKMVQITTAEVELSFYRTQVDTACYMGFKPGFASAKWKEKFGRWPPWSWSEETKRRFADDEEWQARLERRTREREWKDAPAVDPVLADGAEGEEAAPDPDSSFADWLDSL